MKSLHVVLGFAIALAFAGVPTKALAQGGGQYCNWCDDLWCSHAGCLYACTVEFTGEVCGAEHGNQLHGCSECINPEEEEEQQDLLVLSQLRPDGTVLAPGTMIDGISADWFHLIGTRVSDGIVVTRSACSQDVLFLWQDDRAIQQVRAETASIEL